MFTDIMFLKRRVKMLEVNRTMRIYAVISGISNVEMEVKCS